MAPHPAEMLFDLEKDPDELHDLSGTPEYAEILSKMRQALSDLSLIHIYNPLRVPIHRSPEDVS